MPTERKFYRTTFTFAVLSDEPIPEDMELETVLAETVDGRYLLDLAQMPGRAYDEALTRRQMANACRAAGSDPGFFSLDDEGNDTEDY